MERELRTPQVGDLVGVYSIMVARRPKRQSKVHLARLKDVPTASGETFLYPETTSLCGKRNWGPADSKLSAVDCLICLRLERKHEH